MKNVIIPIEKNETKQQRKIATPQFNFKVLSMV